jgi:hypothetical protein
MWFLAVVAGIVAVSGPGLLAKRVCLAGRPTLGGVIDLLRWLLWVASIRVAIGLARHETAWIVTWQALVVISGGLAGWVTYLFGKAAYRTSYRILRQRRGNAAP